LRTGGYTCQAPNTGISPTGITGKILITAPQVYQTHGAKSITNAALYAFCIIFLYLKHAESIHNAHEKGIWTAKTAMRAMTFAVKSYAAELINSAEWTYPTAKGPSHEKRGYQRQY
jgi:hypothetical protein